MWLVSNDTNFQGQPLIRLLKRDTGDIQNYRPIVLLSVFSKLLEKLVYNRLMAFMEGNGVLTEAQHGFRTKKKTN